MKASELYEKYQDEVDELQKQLRNNVHDQMLINQKLENRQAQMKALVQTVVKNGDRELTSEELNQLGS